MKDHSSDGGCDLLERQQKLRGADRRRQPFTATGNPGDAAGGPLRVTHDGEELRTEMKHKKNHEMKGQS